MKKIRFVDWFAGIGGFRLGLERTGLYRNVGACENDKWCRHIYRERFGKDPEFEDATQVAPFEIPDHDLFCGGFPCQSFSIAGKRKGFQDTRGTLFFDICRVLDAKRPGYFWLENVRGLLGAPETTPDGRAVADTNGWVFYHMLETLGDLGYDVQWQVLNSRHFGLPQSRERVYIIGNIRGRPRPRVFPFREETRPMEPAEKELIRPIGQLWNHQSGRVYCPDNIAPTQTTQPGVILEMPDGRLRWTTPEEGERMQGFPAGWTSGAPKRQRYKQIGNAVSPVIIEDIGRKLYDEIELAERVYKQGLS